MGKGKLILDYEIILIMCGCLSSASKEELLVQLDEFSVIRQAKLAEGAYGEVWKCRASGDCIYALKEIRLQNSELSLMYQKEARILTKLRDSAALRSIRLIKAKVAERQGGKVGCLLLEFGTISLFDEISSRKFTQGEFIKVMLEVACCLEEIHALGVFHLDLKPENLILVDGRYKLCDFGSAVEAEVDCSALPKREKNQWQEYFQSNSTLIYRSPEMIELERVVGAASDMWMLGCIAYFAYFRKHPFQGQGKLAIISNNIRYPEDTPITAFMQSLLILDPKQRPTATSARKRLEELQKTL